MKKRNNKEHKYNWLSKNTNKLENRIIYQIEHAIILGYK